MSVRFWSGNWNMKNDNSGNTLQLWRSIYKRDQRWEYGWFTSDKAGFVHGTHGQWEAAFLPTKEISSPSVFFLEATHSSCGEPGVTSESSCVMRPRSVFGFMVPLKSLTPQKALRGKKLQCRCGLNQRKGCIVVANQAKHWSGQLGKITFHYGTWGKIKGRGAWCGLEACFGKRGKFCCKKGQLLLDKTKSWKALATNWSPRAHVISFYSLSSLWLVLLFFRNFLVGLTNQMVISYFQYLMCGPQNRLHLLH